MRSRYFEFNGKKFTFQGDLDLVGSLMDFVLEYGDEALRAMKQLQNDPEQSKLLQELLDQGMLEKIKGRFRLTPRAVNAMQRKALMEVFRNLKKGARDSQNSPDSGGVGERIEGTRAYQWGDPISEIDLSATMRNAMAGEATERRSDEATEGERKGEEQGRGEEGMQARRHEGTEARREEGAEARGGAGRGVTVGREALLPIRLRERDLELHNSESRTSCSTVVLLDQSGSMARFGRFVNAKKCAMALIALIRQRFPLDTVDLVGFYSGAEAIADERLPMLMPKPVTMYDSRIRLRVPLGKLDSAPQHFTNLHMGLMKAKRILQRRAGDNKMVFIITDGQPTAHVQGEYVYLLYPPDEASHYATLREAMHLAKTGVRVCTFALTDDYWDMDWLGFVNDLGKLTRGVTFQCASGDLSSCVMESYLSGRKKKTYIA